MTGESRLLAVLGSPIAHSKSPVLHRAAYEALGLPWRYEAIEVSTDELPEFIGSRTPEWRGLSLTMPLKRDVLPLLDTRHELVELTGAANTVLFHDNAGDRMLKGFNTDVFGITAALLGAGIGRVSAVRVLGAGATAASAIVAVAQLGAGRVAVSARTPERMAGLVSLGERLGVEVRSADVRGADVGAHTAGFDGGFVPDAVISTMPGGADHDLRFDEATRASSVLLDVAYDPWPSQLALSWLEAGGRVASGLDMLLNQALMQVRIFVAGSPADELPEEPKVLAAMRAAVALD